LFDCLTSGALRSTFSSSPLTVATSDITSGAVVLNHTHSPLSGASHSQHHGELPPHSHHSEHPPHSHHSEHTTHHHHPHHRAHSEHRQSHSRSPHELAFTGANNSQFGGLFGGFIGEVQHALAHLAASEAKAAAAAKAKAAAAQRHARAEAAAHARAQAMAQQNEINTAATSGAGLGHLQQEALHSIRYPLSRLESEGYRIHFVPGSQAPSPEYFGNTFNLNTTTGAASGGPVYTDIYVQPGESMSKLEGVTAFEMGHAQWALKASPAGGQQQLIHAQGSEPGGTWGPYNDQPENAYLSGLYSNYFSNKYSPGVGNWSTVHPTAAATATMNRLSNL